MSHIRTTLLMNGMLLFFITMGAAMVWMCVSAFGETQADKKTARTAGRIVLATIPIHAFIIWSVETWAK